MELCWEKCPPCARRKVSVLSARTRNWGWGKSVKHACYTGPHLPSDFSTDRPPWPNLLCLVTFHNLLFLVWFSMQVSNSNCIFGVFTFKFWNLWFCWSVLCCLNSQAQPSKTKQRLLLLLQKHTWKHGKYLFFEFNDFKFEYFWLALNFQTMCEITCKKTRKRYSTVSIVCQNFGKDGDVYQLFHFNISEFLHG